MAERRKYERDNLIEIVRFAPFPHTAESVLKGVTQNYSNSGLCLMTRHALEEGQEIVLKSVVIPNTKTAAVRWCKDIGKGNYKIGVEYRR